MSSSSSRIALCVNVTLAWFVGSPLALGQEAASAGGATALEEVVVTATRREQPLSRVPVSASVVTEDEIDRKGFRSFADISRLTPGVAFSNGSNLISIRGISTTAGAGTTGLYIDETPIQTRNIGTARANGSPQLFDVERVEVLRGPQGTLFGSGSMGGTVRFITPQPSLTEYSAYTRAELASMHDGGMGFEAGAAVGGPVVEDKLGFRVSGWYRRTPGWIDRVDTIGTPSGTNLRTLEHQANWGDATILRGALKWAPVDRLEIVPSVLYQDTFDNDAPALGGSLWENVTDEEDGVFRSGNRLSSPRWDRYTLPALAIRYDFDSASLISNTSYFDRTNIMHSDYTAFQTALLGLIGPKGPKIEQLPDYYVIGDIANLQKNFTQEVRLQSRNNGAFDWVVGAFYQRNRQTSVENGHDPMIGDLYSVYFGQTLEERFGANAVIPPDYSLVAERKSVDEQLAGFLDLTYRLTDTLSVTAGARYADTHFEFRSRQDGPYNGGLIEFSGEIDENPVTPKINVSYQPNTSNLFYVTAAEGFRVGGAVRPAPAALCAADFAELGVTSLPATYKSDSVWSYEVGTKNNLFDNRLRVAASAYRVDWSDIQTSIGLRCGFSFVTNAGEARSQGFDLQADARLSDSLLVSLAVGRTDAKYTATVRAPGTTASGAPRIVVNKGNSLGVAPWTASLSADYRYTFMQRSLYLRGDVAYSAHNSDLLPNMDPTTTSYDATAIQAPSTYLVNVRAGLELRGWDVSVFATNLLNETRALSHTHHTRSSPLFFLTTFDPRTVGVTATMRF